MRALVIDPQPLVAAALAGVLCAPPLNAQVQCMTRSEGLIGEALTQAAIQLVVCDVKAKPLSGPDLAAELANHHPHVRVILIADDETQPLLLSSLFCGAAGFFLKQTPTGEFIEGVQAVMQGRFVVARSLHEAALTELTGAGGRAYSSVGQLSPAERSILALIGQAHSVRSIAASRGITEKTVRNHLARVYLKLRLHSRTEAVLWAARAGLTTVEMVNEVGA